MKNLFIFCILVSLLTASPVLAAEDAALFDGRWDNKTITIVTGPSGGLHEVAGTAAAEILKKRLPDIQFSTVPSNGSAVNALLISSGEGDMGTLAAYAASQAVNGLPPYKEAMPQLRAMFSLFPNTLQIWIPSGSSIKDIEDLKNRNFSYGTPGNTQYQLMIDLLAFYGISDDDIKAAGGKILQFAWGDGVNALRDGNIEALAWTTSFPAPAIQGIEIGREYNLLQLNESKLDAFLEKNKGWNKIVIPAGTYKGQKEDITTIGTPNFFIANDSLDPDLVYEIVKALWEDRNTLANTHVALKGINEDTVIAGAGIELHPGAKKYFREIGIVSE
jgi:TRAP transporter TAXI family solute receptor